VNRFDYASLAVLVRYSLASPMRDMFSYIKHFWATHRNHCF